MLQEINYEADFSDILENDKRYSPRAYAFVCALFEALSGEEQRQRTASEILEAFRETALDEFGPMAFTVLSEWGLKSCTDIGEIVWNLVDSGRLGKSDSDDRADFIGGFDFQTEFLEPFSA